MLTEEQIIKLKSTVLNLNALGVLGALMAMHLLKDRPRIDSQAPDSPKNKGFLDIMFNYSNLADVYQHEVDLADGLCEALEANNGALQVLIKKTSAGAAVLSRVAELKQELEAECFTHLSC